LAEITVSKEEIFALKQEITLAKRINEEYIQTQMLEAIQRYTGVFIPSIGVDWDIVLNEIYPVIQFNLPSTYFRNPRAFLKPRTRTFIAKRRDPITGKMVDTVLDADKSAKTQENILNYIISKIRYKGEVQQVLLDALLFKFAVMWHGYKGDFGMTDEQDIYIDKGEVFVERLSPMRFLKDPAVGISQLNKARWIGRSFDVPLQDLQEDPDITVSKKLKGKVGFGERMTTGRPQFEKGIATSFLPSTKPLIDFADGSFKDSVRSRFVEVYEIFVRPTPKEKREGKQGKVILLTDEQKEPLRKPNSWPYKAEGWPAKILEFNPVPDSHFGLADIDTYKSIADQKNAIVNLQLRNAQENSKVWVAIAKDLQSEEDLEMIRSGQQTIILFNGDTVNGKMAVASPSGAGSSELYLIDQRIQANLEDKSGVSDLKRGFVKSGEESATSVKIRSSGGAVRPAYRQDTMSDFLKESFGYINDLNKQFFTVDEAVRIVGSLDLEWSENPSKEEIQADVDIEMDVISMLPENPEKEIAELQTVLALMVQGLTDPTIAAKLTKEGKTVNLSPIIENLLMRLKIKDPDIFRGIREEESQGFTSVAELNAARQNVAAIKQGSGEIPSPPEMEQDHRTRIEAYAAIVELGDLSPEVIQVLDQLISIHEQLLQEIEQKEAPRTRSPLKSPGQAVQTLGES
jgi:hypothetical protein